MKNLMLQNSYPLPSNQKIKNKNAVFMAFTFFNSLTNRCRITWTKIRLLCAILFWAALSTITKAQNDCNWRVVVYDAPQSTGSIVDPMPGPGCQDQTSCFPLFYYVYLERIPDPNCTGTGCPYTIDIENLSILGKLNVLPGISTLKTASTLNQSKSFECTPIPISDPLNPNAFDFSVEESNGSFAFFYAGGPEGATSLTVYGRKLLFVIAVNAFPEEIVSIETTSVILQHAGANLCAGMTISEGDAKSVGVPAACALDALRLRLGQVEDVPTADFPNRKRLVVYMSSSNPAPTPYTVDAMDFLMKITSTQFMGEAFIEVANAAMSATLLYEEPPANSTMNRRVFAQGEQINLTTFLTNTPDANNTLFYLVFNGPLLASDCAITTIELMTDRRMVLNGICCSPNTGDTSREINWGNSSDCPENCPFNTIKVEEATVIPSGGACTDMFFDVYLYSSMTNKYEAAYVVMDVYYAGGPLSWSEPLSGSNFCAPPSSCVSVVPLSGQNDVLRVTIDLSGVSINVGPVSPVGLFRLGFQGSETCIAGVKVYDAFLIEENTAKVCLPRFESAYKTGADNGGDDLCTKEFFYQFKPWWEPTATVTDVYYDLRGPAGAGCDMVGCSPTGTGSLCLCEQNTLTFTPSKDDNHLNGVTTYDLVLISKHILGIEPFGSPYRMIAADANKSNSITTFDIVELRKLILGSSTELPNNTSWRFVDADYVFSNPNDPFSSPFPELVEVYNSPPTSHFDNFKALKVGDVNESALYNLRPAGPAAGIAYAVQAGAATGPEAAVSVPVYTRETLTASAWQIALRYDPERFKLKNVRITGPELAGNLNNGWDEPTPGEVRILWFDAEAQTYTYHESAPLFYLDMEALYQTAGFTMDIDEQVLYAEAYDSTGAVRRFDLERGASNAVQPPASEHKSASLWSARVYPNPNTGVFRLNIDLPEAGGVTLQLTDQHGTAIHRQELKLLKGDNLIGPDKLPRLQPGAYILHINTALGAQQIAIIVSDRR